MRLSHRLALSLLASVTLVAMTAATLPGNAGRHAAAARHGSMGARGAAPARELRLGAGALRRMLGLYASYRGIPVTDIAATFRQVRAARLANGGEWAAMGFLASARAPLAVQVGFQDGGATALFSRAPGGTWQVAGLGGEPLGCGTVRLPARVRALWHLARCSVLMGSVRKPAVRDRTSAGTAADVADIALANVGVADTPASLDWGFDCNPYTTLDGVGASHHRCGHDQTFDVRDQNQLWCADFAKYVWTLAGVDTDATTLSAAASSFTVWGAQQGEQILFRGVPAIGDAVVFYPKGTWRPALLGGTARHPYPAPADHVAIVAGITNGLPDLVNGDFMGNNNIYVESDQSIDLRTWARQVWGKGEKWVVVSPNLPTGTPAPSP